MQTQSRRQQTPQYKRHRRCWKAVPNRSQKMSTTSSNVITFKFERLVHHIIVFFVLRLIRTLIKLAAEEIEMAWLEAPLSAFAQKFDADAIYTSIVYPGSNIQHTSDCFETEIETAINAMEAHNTENKLEVFTKQVVRFTDAIAGYAMTMGKLSGTDLTPITTTLSVGFLLEHVRDMVDKARLARNLKQSSKQPSVITI